MRFRKAVEHRNRKIAAEGCEHVVDMKDIRILLTDPTSLTIVCPYCSLNDSEE
jgi:hypothetical protein